jgi:hydroxymethylpyrimidine pyrophosphatase-like HAD family hydrolase
MAIGDGPNDLELFEACGISAAMGNALESVKQAADLITDDIDEGGFEKIFKEYILEEGETA